MMDHLVEQDVKMLVIACNSASAAMLRDARERYDVPVVEVISPRPAGPSRATRNGKVGVIATRATIAVDGLSRRVRRRPDIRLTGVACPRLVEFVERGETMSEELIDVVREYLEPIMDAGCDTLILGCTHYPLLTGAISYVVGDGVTLVSSADETAKDVYRILHDLGLAASEARPTGTGSARPATLLCSLDSGAGSSDRRSGTSSRRPIRVRSGSTDLTPVALRGNEPHDFDRGAPRAG